MHRDGRMNTAMALPGVLCACALVFAGCSSQPDSSGAQGGALHLIGSPVKPANVSTPAAKGTPACDGADSGTSDDGGADFLACQVDDDCVAVRLGGCCNNGWKTAVNRDEVDAYEASAACHQQRPICPMYIVNDVRVAECNRASLQCEMVDIDKIACGGFIAHPHQCPDGYACVYGRIPDVPGHCVADGD